MSSKKILFIQNGQYGYDYTTYNIIQNISSSYYVFYIGVNENLGIIQNNNSKIEIREIDLKNKGILGKLEFHNKVLKLIDETQTNFHVIHFFYYMFCSHLVLKLGRKKTIVDFRTGYITKNTFKRIIKNLILKLESNLFSNITTLSHGLKKFLQLPNRTNIVELGANLSYTENQIINKKNIPLSFLYVGTLNQRKIDIFLRGLINYFSFSKKEKGIFTLIGSGDLAEINKIRELIELSPPNLHVKFLGPKLPKELPKFYLNHNIGVSYVPIETKYNHQPVTKSIEYLMNGLLVLGTKTNANMELLNSSNSILIEDSINDVVKCIRLVKKKLLTFDRQSVRIKSKKYSWNNVIKNQLIPIITQIEIRTNKS